jgi:hypothetical protein
MNMGRRRASRGLRQITEGLGTLDAEVFGAIANSRSPLLDTTMPALSRAADHAKLWLVGFNATRLRWAVTALYRAESHQT